MPTTDGTMMRSHRAAQTEGKLTEVARPVVNLDIIESNVFSRPLGVVCRLEHERVLAARERCCRSVPRRFLHTRTPRFMMIIVVILLDYMKYTNDIVS